MTGMRWALVALVLMGCDASGVMDREMPPSPAPPVALAAGTMVEQLWQFRNSCDRPVVARVWADGQPAQWALDIEPKDLVFSSARCAIGQDVCFGSLAPDPIGCIPCSPGWLPVRKLDCQ